MEVWTKFLLTLLLLDCLISFPLFESNATQYHLILSHPRSGSTFLVDVLNSHPCIKNIGEGGIFTDDYFEKAVAGFPKDMATYNSSCSESFVSIGGKIHTESLALEASKDTNSHPKMRTSQIETILQSHSVKIILYFRRNLLEYYLSYHNFGMSKIPMHCRVQDKGSVKSKCDHLHTGLGNKTYALNIAEFKSFIDVENARYHSLVTIIQDMAKRNKLSVLLLPYEKVMDSPTEASAAILSFLGFPPGPELRALKQVKRLPHNVSSLLKNFEVVKAALPKLCAACGAYIHPGLSGVSPAEAEIRILSR